MAEKRVILIDRNGNFVGTVENPLYIVADGSAVGGSGIYISDTPPDDHEASPVWLKTSTNEIYYWDADWVKVSGGGSGSVYVGPSVPADPVEHPLWMNNTNDRLYYYVPNSGGGGEWRMVNGVVASDLDFYLHIPVSDVPNTYDVVFYKGGNVTHTNGIRTNLYKQFDVRWNQIKNAVIDCGAFYE